MPLGVYPFLMLRYLLRLFIFKNLRSLEYIESSRSHKSIVVNNIIDKNTTHHPITMAYYLNPNETNKYFM